MRRLRFESLERCFSLPLSNSMTARTTLPSAGRAGRATLSRYKDRSIVPGRVDKARRPINTAATNTMPSVLNVPADIDVYVLTVSGDLAGRAAFMDHSFLLRFFNEFPGMLAMP